MFRTGVFRRVRRGRSTTFFYVALAQPIAFSGGTFSKILKKGRLQIWISMAGQYLWTSESIFTMYSNFMKYKQIVLCVVCRRAWDAHCYCWHKNSDLYKCTIHLISVLNSMIMNGIFIAEVVWSKKSLTHGQNWNQCIVWDEYQGLHWFWIQCRIVVGPITKLAIELNWPQVTFVDKTTMLS
jgi:hypothetical protein